MTSFDTAGDLTGWSLIDETDGFEVDDDVHDDPVLVGPDGQEVNTWRENYPYEQRMTRLEYEVDKRAVQIELLKVAGLGQGDRAQAGAGLRGPGRRGQGRHHQAVHGAPEPPRRAGGRAGEADGAGSRSVVLPALRLAAAVGRRDRAVRPLLVQPRRRRTRHGLLHRRAVLGVHAAGPGVRADARAQRHPR